MKNVLDHSFAFEKHFEEMTRIPHGSYNEKQYSDYIVEFAKKHNLECKQYEVGNVIVYKPGTVGYENKEPVVLQSHMDMVCEKDMDSNIDFEVDPLELYIEEGFIKAKGTTLGADNGVGVAYMLSILESNDIPHPPLECIFTVQEEVGCGGAKEIDPEDIQGKVMIGLDDCGGVTTYIASAGGMTITLNKQIANCPVCANDNGFKLNISGLLGGHSGTAIHKERGNSIKVAARLLMKLGSFGSVKISSFEGGLKENVIPKYCEVLFVSELQPEQVSEIINIETERIKKELEFSDNGLVVNVETFQIDESLDSDDSIKLIEILTLLPNGLKHSSVEIEGLSVASENIGIIKVAEGNVEIVASLRGALESYIDELYSEYEILAKLFGFDIYINSRYPAWEYVKQSKTREMLVEKYKEVTGKDLDFIAVHGGLECGFIKEKFPEIDIVTLGPLILDEHTTDESLNISSFHEIFEVLKKMLKDF